jgi:hypothetical protein
VAENPLNLIRVMPAKGQEYVKVAAFPSAESQDAQPQQRVWETAGMPAARIATNAMTATNAWSTAVRRGRNPGRQPHSE